MNEVPAARAQVHLGPAGEVAAVVFPVSRGVVGDHGLLGGKCCPHKGLAVYDLTAMEQGDSETFEGCHRGHPALDGE